MAKLPFHQAGSQKGAGTEQLLSDSVLRPCVAGSPDVFTQATRAQEVETRKFASVGWSTQRHRGPGPPACH